MIVSVARMSPSSNQRRAMPVVTMMTFQVGVSGVASRSRLTTPTLSSVVRRISSAIGRIASVLPVPVPATMPKPRPDARELAHARAVAPLEKRLDVEAERELDRLARRARRRDDDDAPGRRLGAERTSRGRGGTARGRLAAREPAHARTRRRRSSERSEGSARDADTADPSRLGCSIADLLFAAAASAGLVERWAHVR